jgi:hypothetical protein
LEGCQGIRRQGASFPRTFFLSESGERRCQLCKVADVTSEEVAQALELSNLVYIGGWWSVLDRFEFVGARQNTLFCQPEAKVRDFFIAKEALLQFF